MYSISVNGNFLSGNMAAFDMDNPKAVVSPGGVGFDINCGVRLLRTNLTEGDVNPIKVSCVDGNRLCLGPSRCHFFFPITCIALFSEFYFSSFNKFKFLTKSCQWKNCGWLSYYIYFTKLETFLQTSEGCLQSIPFIYFRSAWLSQCLITFLWESAPKASSPWRPETWKRPWRWEWTGPSGKVGLYNKALVCSELMIDPFFFFFLWY